jgi:hypothetical protein
MKNYFVRRCNKFNSLTMICALLTLMISGACATPPPAVSGASFNSAKRVAIVNVARAEPLMMGARYGPANNVTSVGPNAGGLVAGLVIAGTAANAVGNANEFNERAPAGFAVDLQNQFSKLMQSEVAVTGRETILVEIDVPAPFDKNNLQLVVQSIRAKCATCDHALIFSSAFGYTKGDRVLNPTAESAYETVRLADATNTGYTPFLIQRDFSNSAVGHEHYNDFRNDKRDHYALLRGLPAVAARAIAKELR